MAGWLRVLLALLFVVSCAPGQREVPPSGEVAPALRGFDFARLSQAAHFAFRAAEAGTFTTRHRTHDVSAATRSFRFTPASGDTVGEPVTIETLAVERDGRSLLGPSKMRVDPEGALVDEGALVSERLQSSEAGVERSWSFARMPEGEGGLVVRMRVSGMRFAASNGTGLHFAGETLGVRIGRATLVDRLGRKTAVGAAIAGAIIELRVPARVVAEAAYPAVLDPIVSAERRVDTPVVVGSEVTAKAPAIAFGNGVWLAVFGQGSSLRAARIGADGTLLDAPSIVVAKVPPTIDWPPALAFDGTRFIAMWTSSAGLYGARIDASATAITSLDPTGVLLLAGSGGYPVLTSSGGVTVVAFSGSPAVVGATTSVRVSRVGIPLSLLDAGGIPVGISDVSNPQIASFGSSALVTFAKANVVYASRLTLGAGALTIVDATPKSTGVGDLPYVAYGGTSWVIAYRDGAAIEARRLKPVDLSPVDAADLAIGTGTNPYVAGVGAVGTEVSIAYVDNATGIAHTRRLAADGSLKAAVTLGASFVDFASIAASPSGVAVHAFLDRQANYPGASDQRVAYAQRTSTTGASLDGDGFAISAAPSAERNPAIAFDGTNHLVLWSDNRAFGGMRDYDIYAARIKPDGTTLDPIAIPVAIGSKHQLAPAVACDGTVCLASWYSYTASTGPITPSDYLAARIKPDGTVMDPGGIVVAPGVHVGSIGFAAPAVAAGGGGFLVAYYDGGSMAYVRLKSDGTVDGAPRQLSTNGNNLSIAFGNGVFLVSWSDQRAGIRTNFARVAADGTLLDSTSKLIDDTSSNAQPNSWVAFGGGKFLVVYTETRGGQDDTRGAFVTADATSTSVGKSFDVAASLSVAERSGGVVYDGAAFVTGWASPGALRGVRISEGGDLVPADGFLVDASTTLWPRFSASAPKNVVVAYMKAIDTAPDYATFVRALSFSGDPGEACALASECESGQCVDGVCCDRACSGQCEACDIAGSVGRCKAATGAPHGVRMACSGGGTTCGDRCDGVTTASCTYPASGTVCNALGCDGERVVSASTCDGMGVCLKPETKSCAPYACDPVGGAGGGAACRSTCSVTSDCAMGNDCRGGSCVAVAAVCSEDNLSSTGTDGKVHECAPYVCRADGNCGTTCAASSECSAGAICDVATAHCQAAEPEADSGGCGCTEVGRSPTSPILLFAAVALFASRRRRPA